MSSNLLISTTYNSADCSGTAITTITQNQLGYAVTNQYGSCSEGCCTAVGGGSAMVDLDACELSTYSAAGCSGAAIVTTSLEIGCVGVSGPNGAISTELHCGPPPAPRRCNIASGAPRGGLSATVVLVGSVLASSMVV